MKKLFAVSLSLLACVSVVVGADVTTNVPPAKPGVVESFQIRNKKTGDLLRPEDANSADGTRLVLYSAQPWKCMTWKLHPASEGEFRLQNHFTSKTFAIKAGDMDGSIVQVPFGKDASVWLVTKLSDGLYKIEDTTTGKALSAGKRSVVAVPWEDKDEQKWELIKTDPAKLTM